MLSRKKNTPKTKRGKKDYLEIYIRQDGQLILATITESALAVINGVLESPLSMPNTYCG
jgi:hypothetical protein